MGDVSAEYARWNALMFAAENVAARWAVGKALPTTLTIHGMRDALQELTDALEAWHGDDVPTLPSCLATHFHSTPDASDE